MGPHESLVTAGLDPDSIDALIRATLAEDLGGGVDVTSVATVPEDQVATMDLTARAAGVVAGIPVAARVFEIESEGRSEVTVVRADGERVQRGDVVLTVTGRTRSLLVCERTALNLLCHLSGVATATAAWADALSGTRARVRDTRKTTPGLRALEKYAVRCGGGVNHRMGLWDAALVKDNHVVAAGGVAQAFAAVRSRFPGVPVEVEVDSLEQLAAGGRGRSRPGPARQLLTRPDRRGGRVRGGALPAGVLGGPEPARGPGLRGDRRGLPRGGGPDPLRSRP